MSESPRPTYGPDEFDEMPDFADEHEGPIDFGFGSPLKTSAVDDVEDDIACHPNPGRGCDDDDDDDDDDFTFGMDNDDEDEIHPGNQRTRNDENEKLSYEADADALRKGLNQSFERPPAKRAKHDSTASPIATPKQLFPSGSQTDAVAQLSQLSKDGKASCKNYNNTESLEETQMEQSFMDQSLEESPIKTIPTMASATKGADETTSDVEFDIDGLMTDMLMEDLKANDAAERDIMDGSCHNNADFEEENKDAQVGKPEEDDMAQMEQSFMNHSLDESPVKAKGANESVADVMIEDMAIDMLMAEYQEESQSK